MRKKRALLASCIVILLCTCIITGMSYALLTDSARVNNHLQAGNLDATLVRTKLEYSVLDEDGLMPVVVDETECDFTNTLSKSIFGLDSSEIRIAPGSYFEATLEVGNNGDVAFDYAVNLVLSSEVNDLAEQLQVTVTSGDQEVLTGKLSQVGEEQISLGQLFKGESGSFVVRVEFIDDTSVNNDAQDQSAYFDLVVTAVQSTQSSEN